MSNARGGFSDTSSAEPAADSVEHVVVVLPDSAGPSGDESEALRGLLDRGVSVTVVTCATSDPRTAVDHERRIAQLGVRDQRFLGSEGARMSDLAPRTYDTAAASADSIHSADPGEVAADIATVIAITGARAVILLTASRLSAENSSGIDFSGIDSSSIDFSGIADEVTAAAARRAARVMSVPLYARDPASADVRAAVVVGPDRYRREDHAASPVSFSWSDQSIWSRIAVVVVALGIGVAIGALGTVTQAWTWTIGDLIVPVGLAAALIVITALLLGLRLLFESRTVVISAAIGVLGVIALLSVESAGGSVLVPARALSYGWIYGPVLIALFIVAWPKIVRGPRSGGTPSGRNPR